MTAKPEIDITVQSEHWPEAAPSWATAAAVAALEGAGLIGAPELCIVLADDDFIRDLNKNWRGQDKPTNVPSFPQDHEYMLGDVIMALETLEREATEQNKDLSHHVMHMAVHGVLHLLGYDHENDADAEAMESLEIKILAGLGLKNPYEV